MKLSMALMLLMQACVPVFGCITLPRPAAAAHDVSAARASLLVALCLAPSVSSLRDFRDWQWPYRLRPDLPYWVRGWIRAAPFFSVLGLLYLTFELIRG